MIDSITIASYLVVRASGDMRVVKRRPPSLDMDEVAFRLNVTIPKTWGRIQGQTIELALPEPPEATVSVDEPSTGA